MSYSNVVLNIQSYWANIVVSIGIQGEILHTPGHSDDSISLLLDDGSVFTGDLTRLEFIGHEEVEVVSASWQLLRDRGAKRVYPGHGPVYWLDAESDV